MARSPQATAKQFVREATIGLVVVAVLLAFMVHAIVRRFGLWQAEASPQDVVAARVYSRMPKPGEVPVEPEREPRRVPAPLANSSGRPETTSGNPSQAGSSTEVRVAQQPSGNPRSTSPATLPGPDRSTEGTSTSAAPAEVRNPSALPSPLPPVSSPMSGPRAPVHDERDQTQQAEEAEPQSSAPPTAFRGVARENDRDPSVRQVAGTFPVRTADQSTDPRWVVKLEDSSFSYCERVYGDPQWFRSLEAWLRKQGTTFDELPRGIPFTPPRTADMARVAPELAPRSFTSGSDLRNASSEAPVEPGTYVTNGSESLFDISARLFGQAGRYVELVELNKGTEVASRDPLEPLPAGTCVQIPVAR